MGDFGVNVYMLLVHWSCLVSTPPDGWIDRRSFGLESGVEWRERALDQPLCLVCGVRGLVPVTDNKWSQWTALQRRLSQQSGPLAPGLITAFQWESTASQNIGQLQKGERWFGCRWSWSGGQGQRQAAGPGQAGPAPGRGR